MTALPNRTYEDWGISPSGEPLFRRSTGRPSPNTWQGLPEKVSMMCTSSGGGTQLPDDSYIFLAVVTFQSDATAGCNCNNSVVAFASRNALLWEYAATVARYDRSRIYQYVQLAFVGRLKLLLFEQEAV